MKKFQKNGGKIEIPKKNNMKFQKMGEKLEFVEFSLINPVPTDLPINFEKFLCSKETSYQNSKNH